MRSILRSFSSRDASTSSSSSSSNRSATRKQDIDDSGDRIKEESKARGSSPVYLNVYDLTTVNKYIYWLGVGVFHSGIEVYGAEYAFGAHECPSSGVFEVEPKSCPGFTYRRSVLLGTTNLTPSEFMHFIEDLSEKYHGDSYHLIAKNCNHFTDDVCRHLTGKRIPGWVNRLAKLGSFCNCLLPRNIRVTAVTHMPDRMVLSDGSESFASDLGEGDEEETNHHLLWTPRSGMTILASPGPRDAHLSLACEL